jgi:energy-coupling factor transporter ATP-binding protein EcfA2
MTPRSGRVGFDSRPDGFHMIRSLEIENYKGFKSLRLNDLRRINVIVGANASGKTSLLEALFLVGGNSPETTLRARYFRGRANEGTASQRSETVDFLWGDLFHNFEDRTITIKAEGDERGDRTVQIYREEPAKVISREGESVPLDAGVVFVHDGPEGRHESRPKLVDAGIAFAPWPVTSLGSHYIPARINVNEAETARHLSRLRVDGDPLPFVRAMEGEFPFLSELSSESPHGPAAIYAKVEGVAKRMPLSLISSGINQVATVLLRVCANPKSMILIDEIENGIFHDRYESIWRALHTLTADNETQIFASTHSLESLTGLAKALQDHPSDVRFFKAERSGGQTTVEQFEGSELFSTLPYSDVR